MQTLETHEDMVSLTLPQSLHKTYDLKEKWIIKTIISSLSGTSTGKNEVIIKK